MARQTPTVIRPSQDGTAVTPAAPTVDGDAIPPGSVLRVTNGNAAALTITVDTPGTVGGLAIGQFTTTVATGATKVIGPFLEPHFRQTSGPTKGLVHLDYSVQTSVLREVIDIVSSL